MLADGQGRNDIQNPVSREEEQFVRCNLPSFIGGFFKHRNNLNGRYVQPFIIHVDADHDALVIDLVRNFIGTQNPDDKVILLLGNVRRPLLEGANFAVLLRLGHR